MSSAQRAAVHCTTPPKQASAQITVASSYLKLTQTILNAPTPPAHQHKALAHLVVVQEGLVRLVNGAGLHLAGAAGAGARAARVGQVNACRQPGKGGKCRGHDRSGGGPDMQFAQCPCTVGFSCLNKKIAQPRGQGLLVAVAATASSAVVASRHHAAQPGGPAQPATASPAPCIIPVLQAHRPPQRRPGCRSRRRTQWSAAVGWAAGAVHDACRSRGSQPPPARCSALHVARFRRKARRAAHLLARGGLQGDLVGLHHELGVGASLRRRAARWGDDKRQCISWGPLAGPQRGGGLGQEELV